MSPKAPVCRVWLLLAMALSAAGCPSQTKREHGSEAPAEQSGGEVPAKTADIVDAAVASPLDTAKQWLAALRDDQQDDLEKLSAFPFELSSATRAACSGRAENPAPLKKLIVCLQSDTVLTSELQHVTEFPARTLAGREVPDWARATSASAASQAVKSHINGDGLTYEFVVFVDAGRVSAVVIRAEVEEG